MRKKSHGRVSHDRWLVSYADFITLLFAFFVVLFATGQSDKKKKAELAVSIQSAFNQMGIFDSRSKFPPLMHAPSIGVEAKPTGLAPADHARASMNLAKLRLTAAAQPEIARGVVAIHESPNGMVVSLAEAGFFNSGEATVRPNAVAVLNRIAASLPESPLCVEGHTDNVPIHTRQFASNWDLSSARASAVARMLLLHANIHAELLSVAGYAEFHPAASNATVEGRAQNRRVDIVITTQAH